MDRWDHDGWHGGGMVVMAVVMVLLWVALAALVVWAVRSLTSGSQLRSPSTPHSGVADQLLAERFARGEISEEEFRRARDALRN
jgi:putative membrane protein